MSVRNRAIRNRILPGLLLCGNQTGYVISGVAGSTTICDAGSRRF